MMHCEINKFCDFNNNRNEVQDLSSKIIFLKTIEGPRLFNACITSSNILILQYMVQIFLLFMSINKESILLISTPTSYINVSQIYPLPPTTNVQKAMGGFKKLLWSFEHNESDIKFNVIIFLNSSAYMRNISSNSFILSGSKHFTSDNGVLVLFCFLKNNVFSGPSRIRLSINNLCFGVLERCPNKLYKDCHRQTPNQTA